MPKSSPLAGIRVLEVASMIFAPMASQYLGDMGAEVIKLEPPEGDITRSIGPRRSPKMGALFLNSNRNKRSIVIDLKRPEAGEILHKLIRETDVLVHSMRTSAANKVGLGYEALAEINPKLIYCHATGYSDDGIYAGRPAYDDIIQAASGLAMLQSAIAGTPRYIPSVMVDKVCGVHAAYAVVLALLHRLQCGRGQCVEVPMMETMSAFNLIEHHWGNVFVPPVGKAGYPQVSAGVRRPFQTSDGFLSLMPYLDSHWLRFFEVAGASDTIKRDPRFSNLEARQRHATEVWEEVQRLAAQRTNAEWSALLDNEDIPFAVAQDLDQLMTDPHLSSVDFWERAMHPSEGLLCFPRSPLKFSDSPPSIMRMPPLLGEHTVEVLCECGFDDHVIRSWLVPGGVCAKVL